MDVVRLCGEEVERLSLLSLDLDVALEVRAAPDRPPLLLLLLDGGGCQEILSNLGDNARRHAVSRIRVLWTRNCRWCGSLWRRTGPGVAEDARERVFSRFVSLDGRGGSGLGLPIARALARSMGGELLYEDGFVLELPVEAAQATWEGNTLSRAGSS